MSSFPRSVPRLPNPAMGEKKSPCAGPEAAAGSRANGALVLDVRNDGSAIPANRLEHLFEPLAPSEEGGGGLGLWVTYPRITSGDGEPV